MLRGASAEAQSELISQLESSQGGDTAKLGEELFGVATVFRREPALRRIVTDASIEPAAKADLVGNVFGNALGENALELVKTAVKQRWTGSRDLADVIENLGVVASVRSAGNDGPRISDELFEVRQLIDGAPGLRSALSDPSRSGADKAALLRGLFGGKVLPATMLLLEQASSGTHGAIDGALEDFQHSAAQRHRGEDRHRAHGSRALRERPGAAGAGPRRAVRHLDPPAGRRRSRRHRRAPGRDR